MMLINNWSYRISHVVLLYYLLFQLQLRCWADESCLPDLSGCFKIDLDNPFVKLDVTRKNYTLTSFIDKLSITSNFPKNYPPYADYLYRITGNGRAMHIQSNTLETSKGCTVSADRLLIWDLNHPYFLLGAFCANQAINLTSYSDSILMRFWSDAVIADTRSTDLVKKGFNISITHTNCGRADLKCPSNKSICVPPEGICDGIEHCPEGEDEICTEECGLPAQVDKQHQPPSRARIAGGVEAAPHSWPWQVFVRLHNTNSASSFSICGGSVIGQKWIMTAGHCCHPARGELIKASKVDVIAGIHDRRLVLPSMIKTVKEVFIHPKFSPVPIPPFPFINYDFCVLQLTWPLQYNQSLIYPVCLPRLTPPPAGSTCYASGFGSTDISGDTKVDHSSQTLQQVDLQLLDMVKCSKDFAGPLSPEMTCASGIKKDACQGDSGGPLACRLPGPFPVKWQLFGTTSFGRQCAGNYPGIYTRVSRAMPFLIQLLYDSKFDGWFEDKEEQERELPEMVLESKTKYSAQDYLVRPEDVFTASDLPRVSQVPAVSTPISASSNHLSTGSLLPCAFLTIVIVYSLFVICSLLSS